jgi:uncharacterized linocin/CFP29 family protein
MNNLHRDLAPVSDAAWASIEDETKRTFTQNLAGRRVADVRGPSGITTAAVGTGHLADAGEMADGVTARLRTAQPVIELTMPFTLSRQAVDDVERGAQDPDWQPLKDAARAMALAEDRAIFDGFAAGSVTGIRTGSSNQALSLPADARQHPDVVSRAQAALRLGGVGGPYALVLGPAAYTAVTETADHGYPVLEHLARVVDGPTVWAPALRGGLLLSTRGGDFEICLAKDLSIGYLSHDASTVRLYLFEAMTFLLNTPEASVPLSAESARAS